MKQNMIDKLIITTNYTELLPKQEKQIPLISPDYSRGIFLENSS